MNNQTKFSKSDLMASLIIGELVAWLLIVLGKNLGIAIPFVWSLPIILPVVCLAGLYIAYLISKKIAVIYQVAKFILVGGFNTLVDWGILAFFIFFFRESFSINPQDTLTTVLSFIILYYSLYKSISFIIAATNSYFWNKFWTFKREETERMGKEFLQFFIITFAGFLINVTIASVVFGYFPPLGGFNLDQWGIVAAVVATVISMVWNFLGYKFIVFDQKNNIAPGNY